MIIVQGYDKCLLARELAVVSQEILSEEMGLQDFLEGREDIHLSDGTWEVIPRALNNR